MKTKPRTDRKNGPSTTNKKRYHQNTRELENRITHAEGTVVLEIDLEYVEQ